MLTLLCPVCGASIVAIASGGLARRATRACISDYLTGLNGSTADLAALDPAEAPALAHELVTSNAGRRWIALDEDRDGHSVRRILRIADEVVAADVIADLINEARAEINGDRTSAAAE